MRHRHTSLVVCAAVMALCAAQAAAVAAAHRGTVHRPVHSRVSAATDAPSPAWVGTRIVLDPAAAQVASQADTTAAAGTAPAGNAERGRTLFAKVGCAQCHGGEAQGSPTTGPRLGPGSLPFAAFARYVRRPAQQMPPYTDKVLSDADLRDIHAFVQSRPKPGTPALLQP